MLCPALPQTAVFCENILAYSPLFCQPLPSENAGFRAQKIVFHLTPTGVLYMIVQRVFKLSVSGI